MSMKVEVKSVMQTRLGVYGLKRMTRNLKVSDDKQPSSKCSEVGKEDPEGKVSIYSTVGCTRKTPMFPVMDAWRLTA